MIIDPEWTKDDTKEVLAKIRSHLRAIAIRIDRIGENANSNRVVWEVDHTKPLVKYAIDLVERLAVQEKMVLPDLHLHDP